MDAPENYAQAAEWFEEGLIDYDQLKACVAALPPPPPSPVHDNTDDFYRHAERRPGPETTFALVCLRDLGALTTEQLYELCDLALKN